MIRMTRRQALTGLGILSGAAVSGGCAVNPVTGERQLMLMSTDQEISMGKESHQQILSEYGAYDDNSMQQWFDGLGHEISDISHREDLPWTFTVLDSPVVNAFAVPGGFVYITRGIMGYFNDEAQFAGVLGHEIGHVTARHTASRYSKAQMANLGIVLGSIVSEDFRQYAQLASLGTQLLFLKFSRDDERQADRLGVQYSSEVGYDATHMSGFFYTLDRMRPEGGSLPPWASTHPEPGDRVERTREMAKQYQKNHQNIVFTVHREEYLERIDGLVFGEDPNQGYVENGVFYHPGLRFRFGVPSGWQLSNKPSEVRMMPESQDAMLIFRLSPGATPTEASQQFASANGVTVANVSNISVDGLDGIRTIGEMKSEDQVMDIASYYIEMGGNIYAFHGLAGQGEIGGVEPEYRDVVQSFGYVNDESKLRVSPERIEIRQSSGGSSLQNVLNGFGVPEDELEKLAILNGLELDDTVPPGTRIKVLT